jgi:AcrR family transcriptional regulator
MAAGRPRAFDKEKALEAAMLVFWRNGYAGTSMAELTQAMGINKPSLYAAYGNKDQLFATALEQYTRQYASPSLEYLYAPGQPLDERINAHLKAVAKRICHPNLPPGCLLANSTSEAGGDSISPACRGLLTNIREETQQYLTAFFAQEQESGTISRQSSPKSLALYLMSINSGMAVLARNGATQDELDEIIEHVVTTFI